jgi:hypothetical protein
MPLERVGVEHPLVCKGVTPSGPCEYKSEPGAEACALHGGSGTSQASERRELRNYKLNSAFAGRAKELGDSPAIKSLNDEIALLRTALEVIFNNIKTENEMLLYVDKIEKITNGIQKLLESTQKLQEKNKELMSRDQVVGLFDRLLDKIIERISDSDTIKQLADDAYEILSKGARCGTQ